MRAHIDMDWLLRTLLVVLRIAALFWATPLFVLGRVPMQVKVLAVLIFSAALSWIALPAIASVPTTTAGLAVAAMGELLVGALLAFGLHCSFAAFQFGGRLLDLQMGFGVASLINPSTEEQDPLLGTLLLLTGVMTFYLVDGHHWLIRGLVQSFEWFPLGRFPQGLAMDVVVAQFGLMFTLGVVLVAPVVAVLLLLDIGLAMAAKTMPQLNVFMLSIPVKIAVGLLVLAACAPYVGWAVGRVLESIFSYWQALAQ
jgi:flagellar biosynthetic protein FliR